MSREALIIVALAFLSALLGGYGIRMALLARQQEKVRGRLRELTTDLDPDVNQTVLRDMKLSSVPVLDRILQRFGFIHRLEMLLIRADVSMRPGAFCFLTLTLAGAGALIAFEVFHRPLLALPAAVMPGSVPLLIVLRKQSIRLRSFESLLPDALDLITGALRSGMAFSGALQVVANESPDPIAKEFTIVFEEHRLGMDLQECLHHMTERVDSRELRIFVTAVILQKETGGNLAEILEGTADIIRDRFRILGDVRTMTAQARLSGVILAILPPVMAVVTSVLAPGYLKVLITDPAGPTIIAVAVGLQVVGFFVIRRIIAIKV